MKKKKYIGTKLVTAEPMTRGEYNKHRGWQIPAGENPADEGYLVEYENGYISWSPKWVFESAYMELECNPFLKTEQPSISQEMVKNFIVGAETTTMGEKTTVLRAVLRNGFEIVESSSCVSKENYSEELGAKICAKKIEDKVWFLLGFLLQTAVHGLQPSEEQEKAYETIACDHVREQTSKLDFGTAIRAVKMGKKIARAGWNGKGQYVELAERISYVSAAGKTVNAEHDAIGNKCLAFVGTSGVQMGWLASQADMLAEDWMIVE